MAKPAVPVKVRFDSDKKITVEPYNAKIFRDQQKIVWTLESEVVGATFTPGAGIVINVRAGGGFSGWPGKPAAPGDVPSHYRADGNHPNNKNEGALHYRYDIGVTTPDGTKFFIRHGGAGNDDRSRAMLYDPDISNEPQP